MGPASWHQVDKERAQLPAATVRCRHKMSLLKVTLSASGGVLVAYSDWLSCSLSYSEAPWWGSEASALQFSFICLASILQITLGLAGSESNMASRLPFAF